MNELQEKSSNQKLNDTGKVDEINEIDKNE